jgi:hypothetical protein
MPPGAIKHTWIKHILGEYMRKTFLTIALTVFMATAPALAQGTPSAAPAPSTEQPAPAETDATKEAPTKEAPNEAPKEGTRKAQSAHPRRVVHYRYGWYVWPWTWAWYHLRYPFYYHHHRT